MPLSACARCDAVDKFSAEEGQYQRGNRDWQATQGSTTRARRRYGLRPSSVT